METKISGRYYTEATDAFVILDLNKSGIAWRYNSHLGGDYISTGSWEILNDSVQLNFKTIYSIWEENTELNDTFFIDIDWSTNRLRHYKKIDKNSKKDKKLENIIIRLSDKLLAKNNDN